jgi:DNA repair protein RecO (recombination protein O)
MRIFEAEALVADSTDYAESDRIVTFLTKEEGKMRGIAKGARNSRRRFVNCFEPFSHVKVRFREKGSHGLAFVDACELIGAWSGLRSDLRRMVHASYLLDLARTAMQEGQESAEIFEAALFFIGRADRAALSREQIRSYEFRMLAFSGYKPNFESCASCRTGTLDAEMGFLFESGKVVCGACRRRTRDTVSISRGTAAALARSLLLPLDGLFEPGTLKGIGEESAMILPKFFEYHFRTEIRSRRFLEEVQ